MKKFLFFLMALVVFAFTACDQQIDPSGDPSGDGSGTGNTDKPAVIDPNTTLTLSVTEISLTPGATQRINVTINPQPTGKYKLLWTSSNPAVATVEAAVVTGVASGEAVITAQIEGTEIKATANVKVGTAIENVDFVNVKVIGYDTNKLPLSVKAFDYDEEGNVIKDENGDTIWNEVNDLNGDGKVDFFIPANIFIMPNGMIFDGESDYSMGLSGRPNYVIIAQSYIIFDGTYVYPVWDYKFSDDPEVYLTDTILPDTGKPCIKWRYMTYTHFNQERYGNYWYRRIGSQGQWGTEADIAAWVEEGGYYYNREYDSWVGYLDIDDEVGAFLSIAGLVSGGNGLTVDLEEVNGTNQTVLSYLDVEVDFFGNLDYYGLAIDGEQFVIEGEGDNAYLKMAEMTTRKFSFDKRTPASAPKKAPAKGMTMKRMKADVLTNLPMVQMFAR